VEGAFDPQTLGIAILGLITLALVPVGCVVYWRIIRRTLGGGAEVRVDRFGFPELIPAVLLVAMFLRLASLSMNAGPHPVQSNAIIQGSIFYLFLVAAIATFLQFRVGSIGELFGFHALTLKATLKQGLILVLSVYPLMALVAVIMAKLLGPEAEPQGVVTFFQDAARNADTLGMASTVFMAAILAPFAEEFIFRGFLYGVSKRFLGIVPAILITSALFAAIHSNLAALPALFVLAICLNLAYERTGSLAVPMVMHSVFNLSQLAILFYTAHSPEV